MKKSLFFILTIILINVLIVLVSCAKQVDVGDYIFDLETYSTYVKVYVGKPETKKFSSAKTSTNIEITVNSREVVDKNSLFFENCIISILIIINEESIPLEIKLDEQGYYNENVNINFSPTYEINMSYKITGAQGVIVVNPYVGLKFEYNGIKYEYISKNIFDSESSQDLLCERVTKIKKAKIVYFDKYVYYNNLKVEVDFSNICSLAKNTDFFGFKKENNVKVIVFRGEVEARDFTSHSIIGSISTLSSLNTAFPNLEAVVFENISSNEGHYSLDCNFPENGVDIYINDNTEEKYITKELSNTYFVNGIYEYELFNEERYE